MTDVQACAACEHHNELPYLFCEACGAPRIRLGWLRMVINITFAMAAFLVTYLFAGDIGWDWPLFSYYAFFLLQFMLVLVSGRWALMFKTLVWTSLFYVLSMVILTTLNVKGGDFFLHLAGSIPDMAAAEPTLFYSILGGVLGVGLLPFAIRWTRLYGWLNAYRIVLLTLFTLAMVALLGGRLLAWVHARKLLPGQEIFLKEFVNHAKPALDTTLGWFAWITLRVLVFEVFVTSALKGYRAATVARLPDAARLSGESALVRSLVRLGQMLRRFLLLIEGMVHSLLATLAALGRSLWEVLLTFLRDLAVPTLTLTCAATLLYLLVLGTRAYISENTLVAIIRIMGAVAGLLACAMGFLACTTPYSFSRILMFTAEFGGWLMPNLLVFFLLTSISLVVTGRLLPGADDESGPLPFRIGYLTKADAAVLIALLSVVLWKRRSLLQVESGEEAAQPAAPVPATEAKQPAGESKSGRKAHKARREKSMKAPEPAAAAGNGDSLLGRLRGRVQQTIGGSVRELTERVQGKPAIVDQLTRTRQKREEKMAQLRSLEKIRETITAEAYENLWNEARSELTFLDVEQTRLQTELDRQFGERQMEKATLEARLASLDLEAHESGEMTTEQQAKARATMAEINTLHQKIEFCERVIAYLEPLAGQPVLGQARNWTR